MLRLEGAVLNMCGPADDGKRKPEQEKFIEEFSSACAETLCESSIFSLSASFPIFKGEQKDISVSAGPRRNGRNKKRQLRWIH
jgi:hypothetical protein